LAAVTASIVTAAVVSEDAAGVKPANAERPEEMLPVHVARLQLAGGRVAAVRHADGPPNPEAPFGEVEAVADGPTDAVVGPPLDEIGADAPLHDEVFHEMAHLVVHERRHHRRLQAEAFSQPAGHVVFAPPFPDLKLPGRANSTFARVEPKHDLAERDFIECTRIVGLDRERHWGCLGWDERCVRRSEARPVRAPAGLPRGRSR
jgi:hypothetical protein